MTAKEAFKDEISFIKISASNKTRDIFQLILYSYFISHKTIIQEIGTVSKSMSSTKGKKEAKREFMYKNIYENVKIMYTKINPEKNMGIRDEFLYSYEVVSKTGN
jgi:hypothetical protein